jgi:hypothetical protein
MKKNILMVWSVAAVFLWLTAIPAPTSAGVNVNIGISIPPPPPLLIPGPPPVMPIPRTYVYYAPTIDVDILFFGGYWYRPYRDHWFRSRSYNGPWLYLQPPHVPRVLLELPPGYRSLPPGYRPIPYGQFKKNWHRWEKEKYWDRDRDWRTEYWRPDGRDPGYRDGGHGKGNPPKEYWSNGGPPGHQGKGDKWGGEGPPGHSGKGKGH